MAIAWKIVISNESYARQIHLYDCAILLHTIRCGEVGSSSIREH